MLLCVEEKLYLGIVNVEMSYCRSLYSAIIEGHLRQGDFAKEVIALGSKLVDATLELHHNVMNNFLPSAIKFHYQYNLRELSAIMQVTIHG